jgi:hypothetical protein
MARIAGVLTKKDTKGNITHVTINAKKHPDAIGKLKDMGLIEKSQFEMDAEGAISLEQLRDDLHDHIRKVWKKKK